jgi:glycosyltransferase involved in cell wall biosynthesis
MLKLSIITINYNNPVGLRLTIESVIDQTFSNFEWIVIDGGSENIDIDILKEYSNLFKYWQSEPDNGIYHGMNKGILKAQGEFCFFLNSGDYFVDEKILENVFSNDVDEDIIFGNLLVCNNGKLIGRSPGKDKLTFVDIYSGLIKHQASFIRRKLFDKFGLYNEDLKIISDWEFFIKTLGLGGATYQFLDMDISYFDNDGVSNRNLKLVSNERNAVLKKYIPSMMRSDYEYLLKFGEYRILTQFWLTNMFLRVLTKIMKAFTKHSQGK